MLLDRARWAGLASILGGALFAAKLYYDRNDAPPWPTDSTDTLQFVVPILWLVGLTGLNSLRPGGLKGAGQAGLLIAYLGAAMCVTGLFAVGVIGAENFWYSYAFGLLVMFLGLIVVGSSMLWTRAFGRWGVVPLLIGLSGLVVWFANPDDPTITGHAIVQTLRITRVAAAVFFGLSWAALGYMLIAQPNDKETALLRPAEQ